MKFFVLRHKASGKFMPPKRGTWWDPSIDRSITPRLFSRIADAKNCKRFWEEGPLENHYEKPSRPDFVDDGNSYLARSEHYGLDRKPDDLEILEVTLTFGATP